MNIHKTFKRGELENLPSDQLDRMLHEELGKDTKNAALIMELMQILEEREAETPKPNVGGAWQIFVERYNTEIEELPAQRKRSPYRWIGGVAAAILLFLVVSFGVPKAVGHGNIIEMIASWTEDFFHLSPHGEPTVQKKYVFKTDNPGLQQVYDAVVQMGIASPIVPMWLPEGYELGEIKTYHNYNSRKICAAFENRNERFTIYYEFSSNPKERIYPKDETNVKVVEFGGVKVTVLLNDGHTVAIWRINNVECLVTTTEDSDTTIRVIKSVFNGE